MRKNKKKYMGQIEFVPCFIDYGQVTYLPSQLQFYSRVSQPSDVQRIRFCTKILAPFFATL